jgi:alpha-L-arabinofuranosidase
MRIPTVLLLSLLAGQALAQTGQLTVHVDQPSHKISPTLYGLMTEEINHSYDGGLYAELIQNRIFKDSREEPIHWSLVQGEGAKGQIALDDTNPINTTALTTSLRMDIAAGHVGVANEGFWGIPALPNTTYHASFYAKAAAGFTGPLTVDIESNDGATVLATAAVPQIDVYWRKYDATLTTGQITASENNRFVISATGPATVWLNLVSLFPPTFNNRPNGNRIDLMQMLADMHPAFLRLPGGNYLEGNSIAERFAWKTTVGPLENRPGHQGPWGYRSSDGLGLLEYLDWCEDLKIEPVLAVFAGYALRGQHIAPGPDLQPYVQEALDEIEYAIGDAGTPWGKQRAADGHPDPFTIHYVEIGNEDNFDRSGSYDGRYAQFYAAIKARYPDLKLIATTSVHSLVPDVQDDHYYRSARAMERDSHHYDNTPRTGPKIFVGEWASTEGRPTPTLNAALGDAAWMTGMERNSDVVVIASYAPLLVNVNRGASQWGTNLIGYDALTSFGSPSYYAQKMFSENRGDTVLPVDLSVPTGPPSQEMPRGGIGVATWQTNSEYKDIKVVSGDKVLYQTDFSQGAGEWRRSRGSRWSVVDGAYRETATREDCRATTGDPSWTDYTYTLKGRKISGDEGLMAMFHVQDADNFVWLNVGGWGNTRTSIEVGHDGDKMEISQSSDLAVETGRWYDIRVEVQGRNIKAYVDDKLVCEATDAPLPPRAYVFATASRVDATGQVIVKVVNAMPTAQMISVNLAGAASVSANATADVLAGQPLDVNTVAAPLKVAPKEEAITDAAPTFTHEFPAYSVSILKLDCR